jgi:hypothetical protein
MEVLKEPLDPFEGALALLCVFLVAVILTMVYLTN